MQRKKTKLLALSSLLAAIIAVCTRLTAFPIFGGMGYVHIGDAFVFLAAALLPTRYAIAAAAIGGALADLSSGFVAYILPTAIIKALMALMFYKKSAGRLVCKKNILPLVFAIAILVGGYYITEVILYQSFISPLLGMVWNLVQGVLSAAAFLIFSAALDAVSLGERLGL